jgi:hypothetical protein
MPRRGFALVVVALVGAVAAACSQTGDACGSDSDCGSSQRCMYSIADGCSATRTCQDNPTGPFCALVVTYCGCDGNEVGVFCSDPDGYARAPVGGLKQSSVCPRGSRDAGSACSDTSQCGVGQICVFPIADRCMANGVCEPEPPLSTAPCDRSEMYCACDGTRVIAGCGQPPGYAPVAVATPLTDAGCAAADASVE